MTAAPNAAAVIACLRVESCMTCFLHLECLPARKASVAFAPRSAFARRSATGGHCRGVAIIVEPYRFLGGGIDGAVPSGFPFAARTVIRPISGAVRSRAFSMSLGIDLIPGPILSVAIHDPFLSFIGRHRLERTRWVFGAASNSAM
jgi:hypothetical protein